MTNDDLPMPAGDAAKFLGLSFPTFKKLVASGKGPAATQIGTHPKFRPSVLRAYVDNATAKQA